MRKLLLVFIVILFLQFVIGSCVDINTASLSELDEIVYVGPATAQKIVDARPFDSVGDMIRVYGIGEVKIEAIKAQGLACVGGESDDPGEDEPEENSREVSREVLDVPKTAQRKQEDVQPETIKLTPQTIKSEDDSQDSANGNYALYGMVLFCVLLAVLWAIKLKKEKYKKNEFRD